MSRTDDRHRSAESTSDARDAPPTSRSTGDGVGGAELHADDGELALPELLGPLVAAERARPAVDATTVARVRAGAATRWIEGRFFAWSWRARGVWAGIGGALGLAAGIAIGVALGANDALGTNATHADDGLAARDHATRREERRAGERTATELAPALPPSLDGLDGVSAARGSAEGTEPGPALLRDLGPSDVPDLETSRGREPETDREGREERASSDARSGLVAERVLLDRARTLVRERRAEEALAVLRSYAARHRDGALREEAAALEVRARLASGAIELAERAFERLVADYPTSLHRDALRRAIDGFAESAGSAADGVAASAGSAADGVAESAGSAERPSTSNEPP